MSKSAVRPYATYILILVCVIVFAIQSIVFTDPAQADIFFNDYGFSGANLVERPWTIVTSIFIHGDITHLLANILVLYFFGVAVEDELRWKKMLALFFLGAFAGDGISLLFYSFDTISIGASAGIFALIGAGIFVRPFDFSVPNPVPLGLLGIAYVIYNIFGVFTDAESNISYIAHFGGLIVGLAYGFYYRRKNT